MVKIMVKIMATVRAFADTPCRDRPDGRGAPPLSLSLPPPPLSVSLSVQGAHRPHVRDERYGTRDAEREAAGASLSVCLSVRPRSLRLSNVRIKDHTWSILCVMKDTELEKL